MDYRTCNFKVWVSTPVLLEIKKGPHPQWGVLCTKQWRVLTYLSSRCSLSMCLPFWTTALSCRQTAALMGTTVSSQYMSTHQILKTTHTLSPACRSGRLHVHQCTHRCLCMDPNGTADWEAPWNMNNNHLFWTGFVLLHLFVPFTPILHLLFVSCPTYQGFRCH